VRKQPSHEAQLQGHKSDTIFSPRGRPSAFNWHNLATEWLLFSVYDTNYAHLDFIRYEVDDQIIRAGGQMNFTRPLVHESEVRIPNPAPGPTLNVEGDHKLYPERARI